MIAKFLTQYLVSFLFLHYNAKLEGTLSTAYQSKDPRAHGFEPHWRHCVVSLSKNINPSLVQPRKARLFITERLLMGRKESKQTNKKKLKDHTYNSLQKMEQE